MKKVSKIASIVGMCAMMASCKDTVKIGFIESCIRENKETKSFVEQMRTQLNEHTATYEKQHTNYNTGTGINRKAIANEEQIRNNIKEQQASMHATVSNYKQIKDSIINITEENDRLIAMFNSDQPEQKVANEKWNTNKKIINELKENAEATLQSLKEQEKGIGELYAQVPPPAPRKSIKKSKR